MKSDSSAKHFILPFVFALVIYCVCYNWIEHRRVRKGPWVVAFTNVADGTPAVVINQPRIGVTNVQLLFVGESAPATNASGALAFSEAREVPYDVPFGKCIFMDPTFLPGTLTFNLFGHEIELLPRVLILDHREHGWRNGETIRVAARKSPGTAP